MEDFRSVMHSDLSDEIRPLWIEGDFSPSFLLTVWRASFEEDFEVVGISDSNQYATDEALKLFEDWGYVLSVGSNNQNLKKIDTDRAPQLIRFAAKDAAGLDFLLLDGGKNLSLALEEDEEIEENIDHLFIGLGQLASYGEDMMLTTVSSGHPEELERILKMGKQRFVIPPRLEDQVELSGEIRKKMSTVLKKQYPEGEDIRFSLNGLLTLYAYLFPQAFIFEERSIHVHTKDEERGWIHFSEGEEVLVAKSVNEEQFLSWLTMIPFFQKG